MLLAMTGCHKPDLREEAPHWEISHPLFFTPHWLVADDAIDLTSSMNIIATVDIPICEDDVLAAFCDEVCIGVSTPIETIFGLRFYLNINRPAESNHLITLAYCCAELQTTYYWIDNLSFQHDGILGKASDPILLSSEEAWNSLYPVKLTYTLPITEPANEDELSLFCGDECRMLLPLSPKATTVRISMVQQSETFHVRYYSDVEGKIYLSEPFTLQSQQDQTIDIRWK